MSLSLSNNSLEFFYLMVLSNAPFFTIATKGELVTESVEPPKTVHKRMKERLGDSHTSLLKRIEDIRRDVYNMINGDGKKGKNALNTLLHDIETIQSHYISNETFVVQQAEEEINSIQSNAAGQLGIFIQSKIGLSPNIEIMKNLIPVFDNKTQLVDKSITPTPDLYSLKERNQIKIRYVSYQGTSTLTLEEAKNYLKFLTSLININQFKTHWQVIQS